MNSTSYYYYPAVRQGLATAIRNGATDGPRASIDVILTAAAKQRGSNDQDSVGITQTVHILGPGDILGFQPRVVSRIDPQLNVGNFEPNYFPAIEFAPCDFVWRFTPDAADETSGKLLPWITLIVLNAEPKENGGTPEFEIGYPDQPNLPRHLLVPPSVLPPLEHAWRSAHVQITGVSGLDETALQSILVKQPERAVSRLLCTRRLASRTRYAAFVVPTFKLGVIAGLGCSPGNDVASTIEGLRPAWGSESGTEGNDCILHGDGRMRLPYYYTWEFRTSERGDFEHLVRLLEPRELSGLGVRDINCVNPGFNTPSIDRELEPDEPEEEARKHYLGMEGALRSLDMKPTIWGQDPVWSPPDANSPNPFQNSLASLINKPDLDAQSIHRFTIEVTDVIKEINLTLLASGTAVRVSWTTTTDMDSSIEYATDEYYQSHSDYKQPPVHNGGIVLDHVLILEELIPGLTYHFRIRGSESLGNSAKTEDGTFQVPPLPSVVPPIYGRWHYGRLKGRTSTVVDADDQKAWIDVLNFDLRHRMAAGKGAEVIRNQQEALMASAWEQLGAIESTNDLLRRAQFGRDVSSPLYRRIGMLPYEDRLRLTGPVHNRTLVNNPVQENTRAAMSEDKKNSAAHLFKFETLLSRSAFDPALRRLLRPNGPIRKRQKAGRSGDLLTRIASKALEPAGSPPKPLGTMRICDITKVLRENLPAPPPKPTITLEVKPPSIVVEGGGGIVDDNPAPSKLYTFMVTWSTSNATECTAGGMWTGGKGVSGKESISVYVSSDIFTLPFSLTCTGRGGTETKTFNVRVSQIPIFGGTGGGVALGLGPGSRRSIINRGVDPSGVGEVEGPLVAGQVGSSPASDEISGDDGLKFCDDLLTPSQIIKSLDDHDPFKDVSGIPNPRDTASAIETTLTEWLNKLAPSKEVPPARNPEFLISIANDVIQQLDPSQTIVERAKNRVHLNGDLAERFDAGKNGDLLRPILSAPEFPQPMYEPLRDLSHDLLLPGVEKIPQNTIGLLEANRRFIESYMAGLNHEFACELLWRRYPTDQRGTYFRQFWDVSEYVPREDEKNKLVASWLTRYYGGMEVQEHEVRDRIKDLPIQEKQRLIRRYLWQTLEELESKWLREENQRKIEDLPAEKQMILKMLNTGRLAVISDMEEDDLVDLVLLLLQLQEVKESLKDIIPMTQWGNNRLEDNKMEENPSEEPLVLVIRGDLLKRYPNTVIYAIDGVLKDGVSVPGLPEYVSETEIKQKIFPIFHAILPPDLTFLGFPFKAEDAQSKNGDPGMLFVLEERVGEVRFGLDTLAGSKLETWNDLSWEHFGLGTAESIGKYLDTKPLIGDPPDKNEGRVWEADPGKTSSATCAWISCQKPIRISIHADQMIP